MKHAEEIMIPLEDYPHIPHWFTLRQAMVEMAKLEVDTAAGKAKPRVVLVFDKEYQLLGMVRRQDILRGLEPESLLNKLISYRGRFLGGKSKPGLTEKSCDKFLENMRERAERPVSDVMFPITATVDSEDPIVKIIYEMIENEYVLLPVLKDSKVVGVVEIVDVFHEIAQLLLN